jgi:predicted transposase YbfD/YdcC
MAQVRRVDLEQVLGYFDDLEDPRDTVNRKHPLASVVVMALLAVLSGAGGPTAIARWAALKVDFLTRVLPLPHGIPGKDVFRRVLSLLQPAAFQACFANWLQSLREQAAEAAGIGQPVLAVDGKAARRSHDRSKGLGAPHCVSAWASELGLSLGQVACDEKSNEITAIPELLRLVDIRGAIVTIDAIGTQKAIAEQVVEGGADYVLALKGNQGTLHQAAIDYVNQQLDDDFAGIPARRHREAEKGHGREEYRCYIQMPVPEHLRGAGQWKGLRSIGLATSITWRNGQEVGEARYYISSLPVGVRRFARAVRSHWSIENSCHWTLDVTFREDESRIRGPQVRENFAWLNRFSLSLLKQHPGKDSIAMKRRACGWSDDFLLQVLAGTTR